jgi:hypothetical protein
VRLSDQEREALFDQLSRHAAVGRLDVAELERRVAAVAGAQTREEATAVLADLPPLTAAPPASGRPRRRRGHGDADAVQPDWSPTAERFRDPRTGQVMRVWVDTGGGRHYVADEES